MQNAYNPRPVHNAIQFTHSLSAFWNLSCQCTVVWQYSIATADGIDIVRDKTAALSVFRDDVSVRGSY